MAELMGAKHPILEHQPIAEAVFELRFRRNDDVVPEILFGRIADNREWAEFRQVRLPLAEVPETIRRLDPSLKHKPVFELISQDGSVAVRIGPDVLVYSQRGTYPGWDAAFGKVIEATSKHLFSAIPKLQIVRLGLRFINAFRSDVHGVCGAQDLAIDLKIAHAEVKQNFNLNFRTGIGTDLEAVTRIATVDFAGGNIPENTTVILDIDVYTSSEFKGNTLGDVTSWANRARVEKNNLFFSVLGPSLKEKLRRK